MRRSRPGLLPFLVLLAAAGARAASFPPELRFETLSGTQAIVYYHQGLEAQARLAVALADQILARHQARYGWKTGRVRIVLADVQDDPNGFALTIPYPLVQIRAAAPDGTDGFGNYENWLRLVLTHELAHIVHLDEDRGVVHFGRKLLGRAPYLFPNALTPQWMIEGLATYEETEGTAFGRGRSSDSRMVLRMASLDEDFLPEDVASVAPDRWPQGQASYVFGEAFLRDLSQIYGGTTLPDLGHAQAGKIIPYADDLTAMDVLGPSFHSLWKDWAARSRIQFEHEAEAIAARGLTVSRALTNRGIRQEAPRFSPDGSWIAYSSGTVTEYGAIRLVRPDGSDDHQVAHRNGGTGLSWTPDAARIVYDEPEVYGFYWVRSDLRVLDLERGKVRKLTRGLRASQPDVSPDGRQVVFVRRFADRKELCLIPLAGGEARTLTRSEAGVQWSDPHWSPDGTRIAAARWREGGFLDLVLVDAVSGDATPLMEDRARDMEPVFTPDGQTIVFRSDRDGISNLYALRLADGTLQRLTNVLGGAFSPSLAPDGRQVAFADYSSRGYDVHVADIDWDNAPPVPPYEDTGPAALPMPDPIAASPGPYRPLGTLLPRFWTPYVANISDEWRVGAASAGSDPLFRNAWAAQAYWGTETDRLSGAGAYRYDRFWPTLLLAGRDETEPDGTGTLRTQEIGLSATVPLSESFRIAQFASLAWRFERQTVESAGSRSALDLGGVQVAWILSSARQFSYSIAPVEGSQLRLAFLKEAPGLGSDLSLGKATADARTFLRVFGRTDALALRLGGGATFGQPSFTSSYALGGFPDASLFDVTNTNPGVLRGFPDNALTGRSFFVANAEYRFPLAHPQRGWRTLPLFLRNLGGGVFCDVGSAWSGPLERRDVKTGAGVELLANVLLGHSVPTQWTLGLARGFDPLGETQVFFRVGLAF